MMPSDSIAERWFDFVRDRVRSADPPPFDDQLTLYRQLETERSPESGPLPCWRPDADTLAAANLTDFMRRHGLATYDELHRWSSDRRSEFWQAVIERIGIPFERPAGRIMADPTNPRHPGWLDGAELDITRACFTAPPEAPAIIAGREGDDGLRRLSFAELERLVDRVTAAVHALELPEGQGMALYMPMTVECVAAYLGVIRAGRHVISIADSFAAEEVARRVRLGHAGAVLTVSALSRGSRRIPLYETLQRAEAPRAVVIPTEGESDADLRAGDLLWSDFLAAGKMAPAAAGPPDRVTNVLFSSGTTGDPKAIPWTQLTPIKCIADGHFHQDIHPGDVVAWPTNIGWMMGPWLIYAALGNGAAVALFEGLPSGEGFGRFVEQAGVTMLGVVPSLVRAWRANHTATASDWTGVRVFSSTGEASNLPDFLWLMSRTGYRAPVVEYCGGTEIGGGYITGTVVQAAAPAAFTTPALGLDLVLMDDEHRVVEGPGQGEVFLVPPSVGLSETLLNRDHDATYYQGCPPGPGGRILRRHGDQLARLAGGFYRAQGRTDDTMNLGGIKVSSKELERVLDAHPAVHESAAVAVQPEGGGADRLVVFVHLDTEREEEELRAELQRDIASHLNPLFRIHRVVAVDSLPRTASGKLMRRKLRRRIADGSSQD